VNVIIDTPQILLLLYESDYMDSRWLQVGVGLPPIIQTNTVSYVAFES